MGFWLPRRIPWTAQPARELKSGSPIHYRSWRTRGAVGCSSTVGILSGSRSEIGGFARDEENRGFCPLEQFRRHLTKEKLVAGARAHPHHQQVVITNLELSEYRVPRRPDAAHH